MSYSFDPSERLIVRCKILGIFCLVSLLIFLAGMVFIQWDVKPVNVPDLEIQIPRLEPDENAFTWFEKANRTLIDKFPSDPDERIRKCNELVAGAGGLSGKWDPVFVSEVLQANTAAFQNLEKGLQCQKYVTSSMKSIEIHFAWNKGYTSLAQLFYLKSKQAQLAGNQAEATKTALQLFHFGQIISEGSTWPGEWFKGIYWQKLALGRLEELAADTKTSELLLTDILDFLNKQMLNGIVNGYKNSMRGKYTYLTQRMKDLLDGKDQEDNFNTPDGMRFARVAPYFFKPNMTSRKFAAFYRHQIDSVSLPRSKILDDYPGKPEPRSGPLEFINIIKPNSVGMKFFWKETGYEVYLNNLFSYQAHLVALRLKIALRLYEQKNGQLPDNLSALTPDFIPKELSDPLDDKPFRYSKEKSLLEKEAVLKLK